MKVFPILLLLFLSIWVHGPSWADSGKSSRSGRAGYLGVDPFLISSTIVGVVAQRLVRRICPHCIESCRVKVADLGPLPLKAAKASPNKELDLKMGKGCRQCRQTGYLGRIGIFEVMPMDDRLRELTNRAASLVDLQKAAMAGGMRTLQQSAIDKMLRGITTLEEVLRVTVGEG